MAAKTVSGVTSNGDVVEGVGLCACGFGYFHELVVGYVSGTEFSQGDWETDFDAP